MPPVKTFGERIAEALVEDGLLTNKQVEELLEQQKKEGTRLLKLLLEKSYVSEQDMAISMGRVLNVPPINLARISVPLEIAELLPREMAHNYKVVPVSRLENKLFLAMADPLNVLAVDDVRRITKLEVAPLIAAEKAILDKLNTIDAAKTVERIIGVFPKNEEQVIRTRLAQSFRFIVSQRLLPRADGNGRVAAIEVLKATSRTRDYIERGESEGKSLHDAMEQGETEGQGQFARKQAAQFGRQDQVAAEGRH